MLSFFADDTSLFSVVQDPEGSFEMLQHDLDSITEWAHQWKMSFNPDPTKPAEEILFSHKKIKPHHPPLIFNNNEGPYSVAKTRYRSERSWRLV